MDPTRRLVDADKSVVIDHNKAGTLRLESVYVKLVEAIRGPRNLARKRPQGVQETSRWHRCQGLIATSRMFIGVGLKRHQHRSALDVGRHHLELDFFLYVSKSGER